METSDKNVARELDMVIQVATELDLARSSANQQESTLRTPEVRAISRQLYQEVKQCEKEEIFAYCEQLLATKDSGARLIAFDWAFRCREQYLMADFKRFERWLVQYVDGWGSCDDFCTHAFGALIYSYPDWLPEVKIWTQADKRWMRRAAAVVLIYAVRRQALCAAAFEVADLLLLDEDYLVQKGYGWLLKEVSKLMPEPVFEYVMSNKGAMPRTSLRYAIEKLDPDLRRLAMAK